MAKEFDPRRISPENLAPRDLEAERKQQIDKYITMGFHRVALMTTAEQYEGSFPKVSSQPEAYKERFDIPLFVDPRIPFEMLFRYVRIHNRSIPSGYLTRDRDPSTEPYAIWTHDANRYRNDTVEQAKRRFADDEVGATLREVITLYIHKPEIFEDHGVDAAGTLYDSDKCPEGVPYLGKIEGKMKVDVWWQGAKGHNWGALSRGKEVLKNPT